MPKYRRPLNDKQLLILKVLYKFRFITVELMCKEKTKKAKDVMYGRLKILVDQEYIARKYDNADRLQNRYAIYCLTPKGIQALSAQEGLNPSVLHAAYRDRTASRQFIEHCLHVFHLYRQFERLYPGRSSILTKSETSGFDYYPGKLPDIHLQVRAVDNDYFLDIIESDTRPITIRQKLTGYSSHCDEGEWEDITGKDYPQLLLVCATPAIERSMQRRAPRWLNTEELTAYTTSYKALLESESPNDKIWCDIDEPDERKLQKIMCLLDR